MSTSKEGVGVLPQPGPTGLEDLAKAPHIRPNDKINEFIMSNAMDRISEEAHGKFRNNTHFILPFYSCFLSQTFLHMMLKYTVFTQINAST